MSCSFVIRIRGTHQELKRKNNQELDILQKYNFESILVWSLVTLGGFNGTVRSTQFSQSPNENEELTLMAFKVFFKVKILLTPFDFLTYLVTKAQDAL